MPFTSGFTSRFDIPLEPPALSQNTICGGCYVLRPDGSPVRISELAVSKPSNYDHWLLGPKGIETVRLQIGAFGEDAFATRFRDQSGQVISFLTTFDAVQLDDDHSFRLAKGVVLNGFRMEKGERAYEHLEVYEERRHVANFANYSYTMSKCALFIGAGRKPVFLPFEVT